MYYENLEYSLARFLITECICLLIVWGGLVIIPIFPPVLIVLETGLIWIIFKKCAQKCVHRMYLSKIARYNRPVSDAKKTCLKIIGILFVFIIPPCLLLIEKFRPFFGVCGDEDCIECIAESRLAFCICEPILLSAAFFLIALIYYGVRAINISREEINEYIEKMEKREELRCIRIIVYVMIVGVLLII